MTESPLPPADRRRSRKISNGRPGYIVSAQNHGREGEDCPGLAARLAAASILNDIVGRYHPLDECFSGTAILSRLGGLEPRDIALTRSIVTVALRRLGTIRAALAGLLEKGLPRQAAHLEWTLIAAAAQILFLEVPDHAAVDLAVRATRLEAKNAPYASLINGVLRNLIRAREKILLESDPLDHDTPAWLAARWRKTYGEAEAHAIASAHREEPTLDLTVLSDPLIWAERLGATVLPTGSLRLSNSYAGDRTRRLRGRPLVCPGCSGGSAGEAFTGWTGHKSSPIFARLPAARRRNSRRPVPRSPRSIVRPSV